MMTDLVHQLAVSGRPGLHEALLADAARLDSFALVALPGFALDETLDWLLAEASPMRMCVLRMRELRHQDGVLRLLTTLFAALEVDFQGSTEGELLSRLSDAVQSASSESGPLVLVMRDFHEIADIRDDQKEPVRGLLDVLHVLASEGGRPLRIWAASAVEPARVCEAVAWSPFYNVFANRIRFGAAVGEALCKSIVAEALHAVRTDPQVLEVVRLSGGIPAAVQVLVDILTNEPNLEASRLEEMASGDPRLVKLRSEVLSAVGSQATLLTGPALEPRSLPDRNRDEVNRLRVLGLAAISADGSKWWPSSAFIADRLPEVEVHEQVLIDTYVHGITRLSEKQAEVARRLCSIGTCAYADLSVMQHRPGEAIVLWVSREDAKGAALRPVVLKLGDAQRMEREVRLAAQAREVLGSSTPAVIAHESAGSSGGYLVELACADTANYEVSTFEALVRAGLSQEDSRDSSRMVRRLFGKVLAGLYGVHTKKAKKLSHEFGAPKPEELNGLQALVGEASGTDWISSFEGWEAEVASKFPAVFEEGRFFELVNASREMPCSLIHGDLNPRNFLVDGADNLHVIDFSTLRDGPIAKDFARLEVEMLLMMAQHVRADEFATVCSLLMSGNPPRSSNLLRQLPLVPAARQAAKTVNEIRQQLDGVCPEAIRSTDYYAAIALTSVRIALFDNYLATAASAAALTIGARAIDAALEATMS